MPFLAPAIVIAEASVAPVGPMGVAVLIDPLWALFPMPGEQALDIWHITLAPYPTDLIKSAVQHLIATRTWDRDPPLPAHVVASLRVEYQERNNRLNRLRLILARAPGRKGGGGGDDDGRKWLDSRKARMTPEERADHDAMMTRLRNGGSVADLMAEMANTMPGTIKTGAGRTSEWEGLSDNDIPRLREKALRGIDA